MLLCISLTCHVITASTVCGERADTSHTVCEWFDLSDSSMGRKMPALDLSDCSMECKMPALDLSGYFSDSSMESSNLEDLVTTSRAPHSFLLNHQYQL